MKDKEYIRKLLEDFAAAKTDRARATALRKLGRRGEDIIPLLREFVFDPDLMGEALTAILFLHMAQGGEDTQALIAELVDHENAVVRNAIRGMLVEATGQVFGKGAKDE